MRRSRCTESHFLDGIQSRRVTRLPFFFLHRPKISSKFFYYSLSCLFLSSKVASTHGNHNVYITDLTSGKNIRTLSGHPRTPWCIAFHPSSNEILASGCLGGQVRVWDLSVSFSKFYEALKITERKA